MDLKLTEKDLFAAYSLPGETDFTLVIQNSSDIHSLDKLECIPLQSGFIIHPFIDNACPSLFIQPDELLKNKAFSFSTDTLCAAESTSKDLYSESFRQTQKTFLEGDLEKMVLSKMKKIIRGSESVYASFVSLKEAYLNAFVFLYNIPGLGSWIGATPELMLHRSGEQWSTVALAGTKRIDAGREWTDKEKYEQRLVENYFEERLENCGIHYEKEGPYDEKAGAIAHLKSVYDFYTDVRFLEMAQLFHPSPAISGTPSLKAKQYISDIENHQRKYYCGYLGPLNIHGNDALYINLRSAEVFSDAYLLYVGGGITVDSDLELEWNETENKAETLSSILYKKT